MNALSQLPTSKEPGMVAAISLPAALIAMFPQATSQALPVHSTAA